jgi:two-component system, chemotaxis family, CheB/CheR fusion protein
MRTFSHLPDLGDGSRRVGEGLRVLIADDERDTLVTLGILLRSEGFEVCLTARGVDVPGAVATFQPDLVLLDIGMPDRNGYELAEELRGRYGADCPPLIAVTAYRTPAEKMQAKASGFHHHIGKPYNPVALIHLLSILKRKH